jgi:hypothetical protein
MPRLPYDLLSKNGKIAVNVLLGGTALLLFYFYFLAQGPMYWVASWIADAEGRYSFTAAFALSFMPIAAVQWIMVFIIDRHMSRRNPV